MENNTVLNKALFSKLYTIKHYKDRNARGNDFKRLEKLDIEIQSSIGTLMYKVTVKEILECSSKKIKDL